MRRERPADDVLSLLRMPCVWQHRTWLLATTAIGLACYLGLAKPALAADECGAIVNGEVFCSPAGNDYTSGITYNPAEDLSIEVHDNTRIFPSSGNDGIDVSHAGGNLNIDMNGEIATQGDFDQGIRIHEPAGLVTILNQGIIYTLGDYARGISVTEANDVTIEAYGRVATSAAYSHGIYVRATNGTVDAIVHGLITTEGPSSNAIAVYETSGDVNVTQMGYATIITEGSRSSGITISDTYGNVNVIADGEIETHEDWSKGIDIIYSSGAVNIFAAGAIKTGLSYAGSIYFSHADGISIAETFDDVSVQISDTGSIATYGGVARGISITGTTGDVNLEVDGIIDTQGYFSQGIYASLTDGNVNVSVGGQVHTEGDFASGILVDETTEKARISVSGLVATTGESSYGIEITDTQDSVELKIYDSGSVQTSGDYAHGIIVESANEVTIQTYGTVATSGVYSHGISIGHTSGVSGADYVNVIVDGSIVTQGYSSHGIYAYQNSGDATVALSDTGSITAYGGRAHGIYVLSSAGDVSVTAAGAIDTSGDLSSSVRVIDTSGDVAVTLSETGSITTYGPGAYGIHVQETSGDVEIRASGVITARGSRSYGVYLSDIYGNASLAVSGDITTYSGLSSAMVLTEVDNADIIVSGSMVTGKNYAGAPTLFAEAAGLVVDDLVGHANITLTETSSINTYGLRSWGVRFQRVRDYIALTAAGQITTEGDGAAAIYFHNATGSVNAVVAATGSIATYGAAAHGIYVLRSTDDINITVNGSIDTLGDSSSGIRVNNTSGDVAVTLSDTGSISTIGDEARGIHVLNSTSSVSVATAGSIDTHGDESSGVLINYITGAVAVTLSDTGSISTEGDGSYGVLLTTILGDIRINGSGSIVTRGDYGKGIGTFSTDYVNVSTSGTISTYGRWADGLSVVSSSGVNITAAGDITTHGDYSAGVIVFGSDGNATVALADTGSIMTYGFSAPGVLIEGARVTTVLADGDITTYGYGSHGLSLKDNSGDVNVTLSGNISTGNNYVGSPLAFAYAYGIFLKGNDGNAIVTLSDGSTITTQGLLSYGVALRDTDGYAKVIASGDIVTEGVGSSGIAVSQTVDDVTVAAGGTITTNGQGSEGIFVLEADDVSIATTGDITTKGLSSSGIRLFNGKTATITAAGTITTYGSRSYGIDIYSTDGPVAVTVSDDILTYGVLAHGISIGSTGSVGDNHNITLDIAGTVNASGLDADAVQVSGTYGNVDITIAGSVSGGRGDGAGIVLDNPGATASAIMIDGAGSLGALSDVAIRATETLTIGNAGTITGVVDLGDGDDSFTNSGTWYLRNYADTDGDGVRDTEGIATADFGGGDDQFTNTGTLSLSKGTASLWQGEIVGLETFQHGGTIDLQDGIAGDTLSISGTFKSDGGSLLLDAVLDDGSSSPQADTLILENVSLLSASTKIFVANAGGLGVLGDTGILLVDAGVDDSGGEAFTLGQAVIGAYDYELHYDDAADAWYLRNLVTDTGSPNIFAGTEEYPALMTAALMAFGADWGALHNRLFDDRLATTDEKIEPAAWTGSTARPRPWLHVVGAQQEMTADADFDQQVVKLEGGTDVPLTLRNGDMAILGAFLGTGRSGEDFEGSTTEAKSDAALGGLYAGYRSGAFYANAIAKYEHHWAKVKSVATDDGGSSFGIDLLGGSVESGYRFALEGAYLQPRLRLDYVHAASTSFEDASSTQIKLNSAESLTGETATRLGFPFEEGEFYIDGGLRHEFLGEAEAMVSGLSFSDALPGTSGFIAGGLVLRMVEDRVLLAFEGGYAKGDESEELTASAALRVMY
jgi:hypothetical protein